MATASRCLRQKPQGPDREGLYSTPFLLLVEMEGMIFERGLRDFPVVVLEPIFGKSVELYIWSSKLISRLQKVRWETSDLGLLGG